MYPSSYDDFDYEPRRPTIPFEEVVRRVCKKDHQAFEVLYEHYERPLGARLMALVNDREVARDLYQETFIRVWEKSSEKIIHYFEPWLYGIAKNLAIDYLRRYKLINFRSLDEFDLYMWLPDWHTDLYRESLYEDFLYLQRAVVLMTPKYRICLILNKYWGYTQKEIASELGISEKTVSTNISRAYKQLEKHAPRLKAAIEEAQETYAKAVASARPYVGSTASVAPGPVKPQKQPGSLADTDIDWPIDEHVEHNVRFDPQFPEGLPPRMLQLWQEQDANVPVIGFEEQRTRELEE